jgi:hypothetical protein
MSQLSTDPVHEPASGTDLERWAVRVAVAAVVLTIVVAAVRAATGDWYPIGDNAWFAIRARDVLTEHHPWLGTWTSASLSVGIDLNNPGPLMFDLLAIPAKMNPEGGLALGVGALNASVVVAIAWFGARIGGPRHAAALVAAAAVLVWTMGSELLFDPWQPHSLLLPFLLFLVLAWALASADLVALPWGVGVGSLIVQTHLSYAVLVPVLAALGLVLGGLVVRRRLRDPAERPALIGRLRRTALVSAGVALVCWAQPIIEQVAGDGNLGRLARNAGGGDEPLGPAGGTRLVGSVLGLPDGWTRPSFEDRFRPDAVLEPFAEGAVPIQGVASSGRALLSLGLLAGLLAAGAWTARRRGDRAGFNGVVVAAACMVLAIATAAALPVSERLGIAAHQLRFLWPIAVFTVVVPLVALLPRRSNAAVGSFAGIAVILALATLPSYNVRAGPSDDRDMIPSVRALTAQVQQWDAPHGLYLDSTKVRFGEPYSTPVLLELQRKGLDFTGDPTLARQIGDGRTEKGDAPYRLSLAEGDAALDVPPGAERVAFVEGLDDAEQAELDELRRVLRAAVRDMPVVLSDRGERARELGLLGGTSDPGWEHDPVLLIDQGLLAGLVDDGYLDPGSLSEDVRRYAELHRRWERHTVGLFVQAVDDAE